MGLVVKALADDRLSIPHGNELVSGDLVASVAALMR